jgi:hypothetical protein
MSVLGSKVLLLPNMLTVLIDVLIWMIDDVNVIVQVKSRAEVLMYSSVVCCLLPSSCSACHLDVKSDETILWVT